VLLLHGVRADRREMLGRARFLNRLGYGILLIDLPAHGESPDDHITFGAREARACGPHWPFWSAINQASRWA